MPKKKKCNAQIRLERIMKIQYNINSLKEQIEELDTIIKGGAIQYGDRVQNSSAGKEGLHCKLIDMKIQLNEIIKEKIEEVMFFNITINKIEKESYQAVLRNRYILCKGWSQIAKEMNYSDKHVFKIHGNALKEFDNVLKK